MAGAGESSPRITTLTLLLADTWQSDGDVAKAVEILLRDPWPAEEENRELGDTLRTLVREEHYWKTSEVLLEIGRTREALLLLHKVKGLCKETGKGSYCGKADHLIETLVADGSSAELTVVD